MLFSLFKRAGFKIVIAFKRLWWKLEYGNQLKIGSNVSFRKRFTINLAPTADVIIGNNVFFNNDCSINCHSSIGIGEDCIFGENVRIYDHNHIFNTESLVRAAGFRSQPITIGKNCWICSNATILMGAKIGDNCVVGAGAIIDDQPIPNNTLVRCERSIIQESISRKGTTNE